MVIYFFMFNDYSYENFCSCHFVCTNLVYCWVYIHASATRSVVELVSIPWQIIADTSGICLFDSVGCTLFAYGTICRYNMEYALNLFMGADTPFCGTARIQPIVESLLFLFWVTSVGFCCSYSTFYVCYVVCGRMLYAKQVCSHNKYPLSAMASFCRVSECLCGYE